MKAIRTEFTCSVCKQTFPVAWTYEEAAAECKSKFGVTPEDVECDILCEECLVQFDKWLAAKIQQN